MLELAERLIEQKSGAFDPSEFRDRYHDAGIEMVEAKVKGQEPVLAQAPQPGKVIDLMDALRRSLEEAKPEAESKPRDAAARTSTEAFPGDAKKRRKAG
jgi:DNA end-binding protein Ku